VERVSESNELARPTQLPVPIFPLVATFGNTQNYVVILVSNSAGEMISNSQMTKG